MINFVILLYICIFQRIEELFLIVVKEMFGDCYLVNMDNIYWKIVKFIICEFLQGFNDILKVIDQYDQDICNIISVIDMCFISIRKRLLFIISVLVQMVISVLCVYIYI